MIVILQLRCFPCFYTWLRQKHASVPPCLYIQPIRKCMSALRSGIIAGRFCRIIRSHFSNPPGAVAVLTGARNGAGRSMLRSQCPHFLFRWTGRSLHFGYISAIFSPLRCTDLFIFSLLFVNILIFCIHLVRLPEGNSTRPDLPFSPCVPWLAIPR